jgi:hypothetical protein
MVWKPLAAAACMVAYLATLSGRLGLLSGASAVLVYCGVLLLLTIWTTGGPRQFKSRFLQVWSASTSGND